ncbi:hypothetical protein BTA51_05065 [Hahella sp. CCB-MM4]|uniref:hypothetical protein n=1 Tax=Hahella sp. (strain CCB-MM4) TaxID=1926491 RepID=UPI000B9BBBA1|nr:hypothetical protein [Hahella sp. CCB-MM4]OZG74382.1 hypothetical protein BTA51_05065 [Hahella sp. CCB-MM4]
MKLADAKTLAEAGMLAAAELLRNPSDHTQWFIMIIEKSGKSFIIADDDDQPIVTDELEALFSLLKELGFRKAQIAF